MRMLIREPSKLLAEAWLASGDVLSAGEMLNLAVLEQSMRRMQKQNENAKKKLQHVSTCVMI